MAKVIGASIVKASKEHLQIVNDIIVAAKSHWEYPASYLKAALELLKIDENYILENPSFEILLDNRIVGFISVTEKDGDKYLDNLWIHPKVHGTGLGRLACETIFKVANHQKWPKLLVLPDPQAIGFYKKLGFKETGVEIPSRVKDGPIFLLMGIHF